jgi:hypothetical protein
VDDEGEAEGDEGLVAGKAEEEGGAIVACEEEQAAGLDEVGEIAVLEGGAEEVEVGFEDEDQGVIGGGLGEKLDVIAQGEAVDAEDGLLVGLGGVNNASGLFERAVAAVEVDAAGVGCGKSKGEQAGFGGFDGIGVEGEVGFQFGGEVGIGGPKGGQVGKKRGVLGKDEASGWVGACGHWDKCG